MLLNRLEMWCPVRGCGFESHALRFRFRRCRKYVINEYLRRPHLLAQLTESITVSFGEVSRSLSCPSASKNKLVRIKSMPVIRSPAFFSCSALVFRGN
jgi:hypothetical protein